MLQHVVKLVLFYDIFLHIFIIWSIYLYIHQDEDSGVDNKIATDRIDPDFMTNKELFSLLDSRGEVYSKKAEKSRLVALAKTKVVVEESEPPVSADLQSLRIQELKHLLDERGIMYYSRSTKEELITAVNISGPVTREAVEHMNRVGEPNTKTVLEFNAFNFYETLEKHNDSIFLINILPSRMKYYHFNESSWNSLRRKLSYMNFKFGELDCDFERSICLRMKWNMSTLYLYIPGKDVNNSQFPIPEDYSLHSIFTSIQGDVSAKITHIASWEEFTSSKFSFYYGQNDKVPVRIILFTNMTKPPLFLSALSIKHRHKLNFGMVNIASRKGRSILRKLKQEYRPLCLVVTKQAILTYGKLPGEYFTYRDLDMFIQSLLRDFKPVHKWYNKLSFLLDIKLIGLLMLRFIAKNLLHRLQCSDNTRTTQEEHESEDINEDSEQNQTGNNTENDPKETFKTYLVNDGSQRVKVKMDEATAELFVSELLRQRNMHTEGHS